MQLEFNPVSTTREPLIKYIFSSGQGRDEWRKVVDMLYINNFLEFNPDANISDAAYRP